MLSTTARLFRTSPQVFKQAMSQIQVGATIPNTPVKEDDAHAGAPLQLKGKNVIVGVPGAFTGVCHAQVPGYINNYDKFKAKGVEGIYVVPINDVFVTKAWKDNLAPNGTPVHFLADDAGAFTKALGMDFDATGLLGNARSKRYVLVTEGDKVTTVAVEENPLQITVTAAESVLANL